MLFAVLVTPLTTGATTGTWPNATTGNPTRTAALVVTAITPARERTSCMEAPR
jgi:hypothetical protein